MNEPLISVIVPVYKVEKYLDECVESIVNQTYRNLEIILVDDGSPDNCPQMCDEWAEKDGRIRVIHKENGGISSARNAGLDVCRGEFVTFVDSDDWVELDWLTKAEPNLEKGTLLVTGYTVHNKRNDQGQNSLLSDKVQKINLTDVLNYWNYDFLFFMCSKIYCNGIIQKNHLRFSEMTLGEDTAFTLEFLKSAHFGIYVPVIGYHYRRYDESSASTGYKEGHFESMCKLYSLKREYITQAYPVEKNIEKEICKEAYMGILWQLDDINDLPISKKERKQRISSKIKSKEFQNILREQRTLSAFLLKYTNYQTYAFAMKIRNKLLRR